MSGQLSQQTEDQLALARQLVAELEAGDEVLASATLSQLNDKNSPNSNLFQEVGRLTRELHEAINSFVMDTTMAEIVEVDMPDAAERLQYVIQTTEKAAHQTLGAIESAMPVSERMKSTADRLNQQWGKFLQRELSVDDFKSLSSELSDFLKQSADDSAELHNRLNDIMMAQGFQDITGQIIKKVISLVQEVESRLIHLVKLAGNSNTSQTDEDMKKKKMAKEDGPAVPGVTQSEVVNGQDDVDDLLSSLGF